MVKRFWLLSFFILNFYTALIANSLSSFVEGLGASRETLSLLREIDGCNALSLNRFANCVEKLEREVQKSKALGGDAALKAQAIAQDGAVYKVIVQKLCQIYKESYFSLYKKVQGFAEYTLLEEAFCHTVSGKVCAYIDARLFRGVNLSFEAKMDHVKRLSQKTFTALYYTEKAQECVSAILPEGFFEVVSNLEQSLKIFGFTKGLEQKNDLSRYGTIAFFARQLNVFIADIEATLLLPSFVRRNSGKIYGICTAGALGGAVWYFTPQEVKGVAIGRVQRAYNGVCQAFNNGVESLKILFGYQQENRPACRPVPEDPIFPNPQEGFVPYPADGVVPNFDKGPVPNPAQGVAPNADAGVDPNLAAKNIPNPGEAPAPQPAEGIFPHMEIPRDVLLQGVDLPGIEARLRNGAHVLRQTAFEQIRTFENAPDFVRGAQNAAALTPEQWLAVRAFLAQQRAEMLDPNTGFGAERAQIQRLEAAYPGIRDAFFAAQANIRDIDGHTMLANLLAQFDANLGFQAGWAAWAVGAQGGFNVGQFVEDHRTAEGQVPPSQHVQQFANRFNDFARNVTEQGEARAAQGGRCARYALFLGVEAFLMGADMYDTALAAAQAVAQAAERAPQQINVILNTVCNAGNAHVRGAARHINDRARETVNGVNENLRETVNRVNERAQDAARRVNDVAEEVDANLNYAKHVARAAVPLFISSVLTGVVVSALRSCYKTYMHSMRIQFYTLIFEFKNQLIAHGSDEKARVGIIVFFKQQLEKFISCPELKSAERVFVLEVVQSLGRRDLSQQEAIGLLDSLQTISKVLN